VSVVVSYRSTEFKYAEDMVEAEEDSDTDDDDDDDVLFDVAVKFFLDLVLTLEYPPKT